jgi:PEP-CTERM motif
MMRTMICLAGCLFVSAAMGSKASADLVTNGGFDTGDFTGWTVNSPDGFTEVLSGFSHDGDFAAWFGDFQADGGGSISQSLATTAGSTYTLSFWFAGDGDDPSGFSAIVGGNTVFQVTNPPFDADYNQFTFNFTASSASTLLEFDGFDDDFFVNLDTVSVNLASVPEPSSIVLCGVAGLSGLGYTWRRRRRAAIV